MPLTPEEQLMLELINRARANPEGEAQRLGIDLNEGLAAGTIDADAKQPLAANDLLQLAAEAHSEWMLLTDTFSHEGEGGSSIGDRLTDENYAWTTAGENIAWEGTTASLGDLGSMVLSQHESLFLSAGHRQNLLNDSFREVGIAQEVGTFDSYNASMITQNFGARSGTVFLLGVVTDDSDNDDFYDVGEGLAGVTVTATGGGRTVTAETYSSGGYSLELAAGTYEVTFSGFEAGGEYATTVSIGSDNVKVDVEVDDLEPLPVAGADTTTDHASIFGFDPSETQFQYTGDAAPYGNNLRQYQGSDAGGGWDGTPASAHLEALLAKLQLAASAGGFGGAGFDFSDSPFAGFGGDGESGAPTHFGGDFDPFEQMQSRSLPGSDQFLFADEDGPSRGFDGLPAGAFGVDVSGHATQYAGLTGRDAPTDAGVSPEWWGETQAFSGDDWA